MDTGLLDYAKALVKQLNQLLGIQVEVEAVMGSFNSYIMKEMLTAKEVTGSASRWVLSATIALNLKRLRSKRQVRRALSHEFAHLFPGDASFEERWSMWRKIVYETNKLLNRRAL